MNLLLIGYMNRPDYAPSTPTNKIISFAEWYIFYPLLVILLLAFIISLLRKKQEVTNHWNYLIQGLSYSTKTFYDHVDNLLRDQGIEHVKTGQRNIATGGILQGRRIYMTISWREYTYYICAAPFGNSFYLSYWGHTEQTPLIRFVSSIPLIGKLLIRIFAPTTYYKVDTDTMFHTVVHQCVLDSVQFILKESSLPPLSEETKKPIMKDLFQR